MTQPAFNVTLTAHVSFAALTLMMTSMYQGTVLTPSAV